VGLDNVGFIEAQYEVVGNDQKASTVSPGKKLRHLCALAIQKNASAPVETGTLETILKAKDVL